MTNRSDEATLDKIKGAIKPFFPDLKPAELREIAKPLLTEEGASWFLEGRTVGDLQKLLENIYKVR